MNSHWTQEHYSPWEDALTKHHFVLQWQTDKSYVLVTSLKTSTEFNWVSQVANSVAMVLQCCWQWFWQWFWQWCCQWCCPENHTGDVTACLCMPCVCPGVSLYALLSCAWVAGELWAFSLQALTIPEKSSRANKSIDAQFSQILPRHNALWPQQLQLRYACNTQYLPEISECMGHFLT